MKKLKDIRVGLMGIPVTRIALLIISDLMSILLASVLSLYVRYDFQFMDVPRSFWVAVLEIYLANVVITLCVFYIFRLYNSVWRYAADTEMVNNGIAVLLCAVMQPVICWILRVKLPISYPFYYGFFLMVFTCGVRFSYRIIRALQHKRLNRLGGNSVNCMLVGAGAAGNAILKEIETSSYLSMHVVCVIDESSIKFVIDC